MSVPPVKSIDGKSPQMERATIETTTKTIEIE
jgi:hypothetical protein